MTRWYYTDPLAAAWMASKFGMVFKVGNSSRRFEDVIIEFSDRDGMYIEPTETKYFIHPDSVKLLEPKEGDLVESRDFDEVRYIDTERDILLKDFKRYKIIQRNGIAFMWPESDTD